MLPFLFLDESVDEGCGRFLSWFLTHTETHTQYLRNQKSGVLPSSVPWVRLLPLHLTKNRLKTLSSQRKLNKIKHHMNSLLRAKQRNIECNYICFELCLLHSLMETLLTFPLTEQCLTMSNKIVLNERVK